MSNTGPIPPGTRANYAALLQAARQGSLGLMQGKDRTTGEEVSLLCTRHTEGEEIVLTPFAVMVGADVYERYEPALP